MTAWLEYKPLVRLPSAAPPRAHHRHPSGLLGWYAPYALGALALAAALGFDLVPVRALLDRSLNGSEARASDSLTPPDEPQSDPRGMGRDDLPHDDASRAIPVAAGVVFDLADITTDGTEGGSGLVTQADAWPGIWGTSGGTPRADRHHARAAISSRPARHGHAAKRRARLDTPRIDAAPPRIEPSLRSTRSIAPEEPDEAAPAPRRRMPRAPGAETVSVGPSCEAALAAYSEPIVVGGPAGPPDLSAGAYASVLNRGTYLQACGAPSDMQIQICVAVQHGRAVGVTVRTAPADRAVGRCIAQAVRGLSFPSHPRLDVARTTFEPQ